MIGSLYIYFPLFSALIAFFNAIVLFRILHGKMARDISLFLFFAGGWSLCIFGEIYLENNLLLPVLSGQTNDLPAIIVAAFGKNKFTIFQTIKYASTCVGIFAMFIPAALFRISLNFPARSASKLWTPILFILASIIASLSWYGVQFELLENGIKRNATNIVILQMIYVGIICSLAIIYFILKAHDFSSPLRRLEARFIYWALLVSTIIGAGFGYLAAFIPQTTPILIIATTAPISFSVILYSGLAFSRQIFGKSYDNDALIQKLNQATNIQEKLQIILKENIHLSLYKNKRDNQFVNQIDSEETLVIPHDIFKRYHHTEKTWFFAEDYDDSPDHPAYQFMTSHYAQAGIFHKDQLILVHRIQNNKIIKKNDLLFLAQSLENR